MPALWQLLLRMFKRRQLTTKSERLSYWVPHSFRPYFETTTKSVVRFSELVTCSGFTSVFRSRTARLPADLRVAALSWLFRLLYSLAFSCAHMCCVGLTARSPLPSMPKTYCTFRSSSMRLMISATFSTVSLRGRRDGYLASSQRKCVM